MKQLATLDLLVRLSLRSLTSHRIKSLIVGSLMAFGSFLLVLGTGLLDSVESAMVESMTATLTGHLQVYAKDAPDKLAVYGGSMSGSDDIGHVPEFGPVQKALMEVENVLAVVPMGLDRATTSTGSDLDRVLGSLRQAYADNDQRRRKTLEKQVRQAAEAMKAEQQHRLAVAADRSEVEAAVALLDRLTTDTFWEDPSPAADALPEARAESIAAARQTRLQLLETELAPLGRDGWLFYLRYVGTDLPRFARHFDRFEIVEGEMVPEGKPGFLFNKRFYERRVKHRVARELDTIHRKVTEEGEQISGSVALTNRIARLARQWQRIVLQLEPDDAEAVTALLAKHLDASGDELSSLVQRFLRVDDENLEERYRIFYAEIAPRIQLYRFRIGDVMTVRAFTRSGYITAVNVKIYGTFQFRGLEDSDLAGSKNLMDIVTFRRLYGFMTEARKAELDSIREEVGVAQIGRDSAEEALFGGDGDLVVTRDDGEGFDEFAGVSIDGAEARRAALEDETFDQATIDDGLVLNVAIVLRDPSRLRQTQEAIAAKIEERGLGLQVVDWQAASGMVGQYIVVMRVVMYIAIFVIFLVALVIINNSMVMATMERVSELGTMRAIGAGRRFVLCMFLLETLVLGLLAGSGGALLGAGSIRLMGVLGLPAPSGVVKFLFGGPRLYPTVGVNHLALALVVILLVSLLSTLYPALIATRIQPVVAMQGKD